MTDRAVTSDLKDGRRTRNRHLLLPAKVSNKMNLVRSQAEVDTLLNKCADASDAGESQYHGMSYEEGIRDGIQWLIGELEENPLE